MEYEPAFIGGNEPRTEIDIENEKRELDKKRDDELLGFVIDGVLLNKEYLKDMAVAYSLASASEKIEWINVKNETVKFSRSGLGTLIKKGSDKVKEIYFRYRALKDKL